MSDVQIYEGPPHFTPPVLMRASVAQILGCTALTLRNREDKGLYPAPTRHPTNSYRIYTILDIYRLQAITYRGQVFLPPILSVLYDKGYVIGATPELTQERISMLDDYLHWCLVAFKNKTTTESTVQSA